MYYIKDFLGIKSLDIPVNINNYQFIIGFLENRNTSVFNIDNNTILYKSYCSDYIQIIVHNGLLITNYNILFSKFKTETQKIKNLIRIFTKNQINYPLNLAPIIESDGVIDQRAVIEIGMSDYDAFKKYITDLRFVLEESKSRYHQESTDIDYSILDSLEPLQLNKYTIKLYIKDEDSICIDINNNSICYYVMYNSVNTIERLLNRYYQFLDSIRNIYNNCG